jgi:hypothetical protein
MYLRSGVTTPRSCDGVARCSHPLHRSRMPEKRFPVTTTMGHPRSRMRSSRNSLPATTSSRPASSSRPAVPDDLLAPRWTPPGSSVARTASARVEPSPLVRALRSAVKGWKTTLLPTTSGPPVTKTLLIAILRFCVVYFACVSERLTTSLGQSYSSNGAFIKRSTVDTGL